MLYPEGIDSPKLETYRFFIISSQNLTCFCITTSMRSMREKRWKRWDRKSWRRQWSLRSISFPESNVSFRWGLRTFCFPKIFKILGRKEANNRISNSHYMIPPFPIHDLQEWASIKGRSQPSSYQPRHCCMLFCYRRLSGICWPWFRLTILQDKYRSKQKIKECVLIMNWWNLPLCDQRQLILW